MASHKIEHPRPDFRREQWLNLNGEWDFALFGSPAGGIDAIAYDEKINVPFSWACPLSGIHRNIKGYGYYRKIIRGYETPCGKRLFACFGGADYLASVYINGKLAVTHEGGYTHFEAELTPYWHNGAEEKGSTGSTDSAGNTDSKDITDGARGADFINELCVEVADLDEKYQTYGKQGYGNIRGIWQTVYLEARPDDYISSVYFITALSGHISVKIEIDSLRGGTAEVKFEFDGISYKGGSVEMKPGLNTYETEFHVENPRFWDCDNPYLYEGIISLEKTGDSCAADICGDKVHTYFGIREIGTIRLDGYKTRHITLNGRPVYLNGTLDQAFNSEGFFTYPDDKSIRDEVWRLKRIGLNFVRIHIKPEEPLKLYWLDKIGIMVMEDMPCFWGEPGEQAKKSYQKQWQEVIKRDFNHPSIVSWVMFNETWGLLSTVKGEDAQKNEKSYLPETQEWVRKIYKAAKDTDSTRLIEDNSPCRRDHVESDINTWHFYKNGYDNVKTHIAEVSDKTYPGSSYNYIGGNLQSDIPLLNSECGMVWGIEASAGDSDISWHYRYMLNEFRLHGNICGFVFTEFHDVVNEFNGYYRIDNTDKYFGYGDMCRGMTLRDLHAPDFVVLDVPPCSVFKSTENIVCRNGHDIKGNRDKYGIFRVPVIISSFSPANHGKEMILKWEMWYDGLEGRVTLDRGMIPVKYCRYGTSEVDVIETRLPDISALC
ncbi:MAG: glycoside hydrolase family 2 TIM barrel-domain containing protein, partial [Eubacteriales bacterium]|nr:glycoside hydrolase family 2 TIM barrel-domain containing protein [Eubacteriales bacterium]